MRVLQVNTLSLKSKVGGAEATALAMRQELQANNYEVVNVNLCGSRNNATTPPLEGAMSEYAVRIPNVYWPYDGHTRSAIKKILYHTLDLFNIIVFVKMLRILRRFVPDVVMFHNIRGWSPSVWVACKVVRVPIVQVFHDYGSICIKSQQFRNGRACDEQCLPCKPRRLISQLCWSNGAIVGVSEDTLKRHLRSKVFGACDPWVVYPKVEVKVAGVTARSDKRYQFGYLGRLEDSKGIELFAQAVERLGVRAAVAGVGDERLTSRLRCTYSQIDWLGYQTSASFLAHIDCLVVPSVWPEPFGRVVCEAAAYEVPVIISGLGGLPEAAAKSRARAMVVEPSLEGLERAMRSPQFKVAENVGRESTITEVIAKVVRSHRKLGQRET